MFLLADPCPGCRRARRTRSGSRSIRRSGRAAGRSSSAGSLAIPALLLATLLLYLLEVIAFLAWFVCLFAATMPDGIENLGVYCLRYDQQTCGYLYLLTQRYPGLSSPTTI